MFDRLKRHWPEYGMEAAGLGLFMVSACVFAAILEYPGSPVRQAIDNAFLRRVLMGMAMSLTAIGIIYSPFRGAFESFGQRCGSTSARRLWACFWRRRFTGGVRARAQYCAPSSTTRTPGAASSVHQHQAGIHL